ncbi:MAG: glycoside hydrolase family 2 TIM barrel-domain containing protein [Veillonellaceae bacterium]|nr:glycoside hydrolase family 2 TIM barrel-domain containing protein [Veillonellaceae bacterium]
MKKMECLLPVENQFRHKISLDGSWHIYFDKTDTASYESGIGVHNRVVPVPAALQDIVVDEEEADYCGTIWYERSVFAPKSWLGDDVFLRFDGIGLSSIIYINGIEVGHSQSAYGAIILNVTKQLHYGEDNKVVVKVSNEFSSQTVPSGQTVVTNEKHKVTATDAADRVPFGIYDTVTLYSVPPTRLVDIHARTISLEANEAHIQYVAQVQGNCLVTVTLRDQEGHVVATGVGGNSKLKVLNPVLWQPGKGYLYTFEIEVSRLGKKHDIYSIPFAIRTIQVKDGQIRLNGEMLSIKAIRVSGHGHHPVTPELRYAAHDMQEALQYGYNTVLTKGAPYPERLLTLADQMGLVVIQNLSLYYKQAGQDQDRNGLLYNAKQRIEEQHKEALYMMLQSSKHHPSVCLWNVMQVEGAMKASFADSMTQLMDLMHQCDYEDRPVMLTTSMMPNDIDESCLKGIQVLQYTGALQHWQENRHVIKEGLVQALTTWQAAQKWMPLLVSIGDAGQQRTLIDCERAYNQYKMVADIVGMINTVQGIIGSKSLYRFPPLFK